MGPRRLIAAVTEPGALRALLARHGLPPTPPSPSPSRPPPVPLRTGPSGRPHPFRGPRPSGGGLTLPRKLCFIPIRLVTRPAGSDSISVSDASAQGPKTWRHPGGKLVEEGPHTLKQAELLAILIGAGVPGRPALTIANAILDEYAGLYGIHQRATLPDLARIPGMGPRKAARILAAIELGRQLHRLMRPPKTTPPAEPDLFSSSEPLPAPEPQPQGPSEANLLAEIIGSGIRGRPPKVIAEDLLTCFGSFLGLFGQDMGKFLSIKGLNTVKIIRIAAALEIAKRLDHALS